MPTPFLFISLKMHIFIEKKYFWISDSEGFSTIKTNQVGIKSVSQKCIALLSKEGHSQKTTWNEFIQIATNLWLSHELSSNIPTLWYLPFIFLFDSTFFIFEPPFPLSSFSFKTTHGSQTLHLSIHFSKHICNCARLGTLEIWDDSAEPAEV